MEANRKQAMVPGGGDRARPGRHRAGAGRPGRRAGRDRPARARRASCSRCGRRRWRPSRCGEVLGAGDAAARLHAADVRRAGVGDRQEPARDRGATGSSSARSRSPPACAAARSRSTSATATRRAAVAEAVRDGPGRAPPQRTSSASTARRSTRRSRRCSPGARLGLAESCSGGLLAARVTDLPGRLRLLGGQRRRLLQRGEGGAARASTRR